MGGWLDAICLSLSVCLLILEGELQGFPLRRGERSFMCDASFLFVFFDTTLYRYQKPHSMDTGDISSKDGRE